MLARRPIRRSRHLALAAAAVVFVSLAAGDELTQNSRPPDVQLPRQETAAQLAPLLPFDCEASPISQSAATEKPLEAIHLVNYQAPLDPPHDPPDSSIQIRNVPLPPRLDTAATDQSTRLNMPGYISDPMLRRLSATGGDDITARDRDLPQFDYESPVTILRPTAPAEPPTFLPVPGPTPDEQLWLGNAFEEGRGGIIVDHGVFRSAYQQPLAPLQPLQPVQPPTLTPTEPTAPAGAFSALGGVSVAELAAAVGGSPVQGVGAAQAQSLAPTDLGALLQSAQSVQSVSTTRRSPVALDPNIRGYKFGQVYTQANGAYWFPVREDMDSMLSKIDPGMVQDVIVIPGPYGLRYGPGLAFIDIVTQDTPRYDSGSGSDYRANGNIRTNGAQLYGRLTAEGGGDDWGYRISYGHREGDNYLAGNGLQIPSSYDNGDVWAQYGFSTSKYQKVEFSYLRLDQNLTNYAAQFFDVNTLETDAGTLRAVDDDPCSPWTKAVLEGWWNRTHFTGSITDSKRDPKFPVIQRVEFSLDQLIPGVNILNGDTLGDNTSSGARSVFLFGDTDDAYLRMGADFHFWQQGLRENFDIENITFPALSLGKFFTNLPFATLHDEGLFAEYGHPLGDYWDVALGGRVDWVGTNADPSQVRSNTNLNVDTLSQNDILYSYYLTNEFKLGNDWKLNAGMGFAQRPPTLTERYADGMFLGLLQSGFTRVIGNDQLLPEKDWQMDVGISCNYDNFRASATYFYAWIVDYATFQGDSVVNFFDARLVRYINTARATLTGFEAVGDWDWSPKFTPFAKMKYVQGQDEVINGPLPSIPPLEGTVGVRWHDSGNSPMWEFEAGERMVTTQNRLGEILILNSPTVVEERTPGFATTYVRGYYNWSKDMKFVAGIDNVFNRSYQEHLDLRLLSPTGFPAPPTRVLSPGITPYFGFDWRF
jgi:iron complex outermembrane recepter protein